MHTWLAPTPGLAPARSPPFRCVLSPKRTASLRRSLPYAAPSLLLICIKLSNRDDRHCVPASLLGWRRRRCHSMQYSRCTGRHLPPLLVQLTCIVAHTCPSTSAPILQRSPTPVDHPSRETWRPLAAPPLPRPWRRPAARGGQQLLSAARPRSSHTEVSLGARQPLSMQGLCRLRLPACRERMQHACAAACRRSGRRCRRQARSLWNHHRRCRR